MVEVIGFEPKTPCFAKQGSRTVFSCKQGFYTLSRFRLLCRLGAPQGRVRTPALAPFMPPLVDVSHINQGARAPGLATGKVGKCLVGLRLIPVGHAGQVQREHIGSAVLDAELQGAVEVDRIGDMESVHVMAAQPADVIVGASGAKVRV